MKILVLTLLISFCFQSNAQNLSYLNICGGDSSKVCKRDKAKVVPTDALCEVPESLDSFASDYDLTITGPLPDRPWTPSETVAGDESISCALNASRKQARIDALNTKAQEKNDAKVLLKAQCASVSDPFRSAVCELLEAK